MNDGCFKKGMLPWNKGRKWSQEVREKISKAKLLTAPKGKKCWNWKGGRDRTVKLQALKRDDYTCQECGYREDAIMQVDHIQPRALYPELQHDLANLETLCPNCHARKTIKDKKRIASMKKEVNSMKIQNGQH
jgi:DNA-directed RNA polymerase subunit RPC12/RpoP